MILGLPVRMFLFSMPTAFCVSHPYKFGAADLSVIRMLVVGAIQETGINEQCNKPS